MAKALTVKRVEKLLSAGVKCKVTDAEVRGLMLVVESRSSAFWVLRYQRHKTVKHLGLGSAQDVSLAAVRERARRERERLADGIDPLELKRKDRETQRQADAKRLSFREAADRCHTSLQAGWSSDHHSREFLASLERYVFPIIGNHDIAAVGKDEVLRVLEQRLPNRIKGSPGDVFWNAKTITADRVRNRIERVIDFATVRGWRSGDNPARWKSFLDQVLAAPRSIRPVRNMRAVPYAEVPTVMAALAADPSVSAQALRFIVLTAARLGEAIKANWSEIDLDAAEWVIPKERMKGRREHRVPLSPQAVELLRSVYREDGNPHLFISTRTAGQHVVESTLTIALRKAGCAATIHGFRSAFADWAHERSRFNNHVIELSLAHCVGNLVERSYRRTDLFDQRRQLMQAWGAFVTSPPVAEEKKGTVLPMRA
jgi:integrase